MRAQRPHAYAHSCKFMFCYDTTVVPEISVNSSSVTTGNNCNLLNQIFTTTYGSIHLDLGFNPRIKLTRRLARGTRLVTGARFPSVQVNHTPGLYVGPGVYSGPGFCPNFYGRFLLRGHLLISDILILPSRNKRATSSAESICLLYICFVCTYVVFLVVFWGSCVVTCTGSCSINDVLLMMMNGKK